MNAKIASKVLESLELSSTETKALIGLLQGEQPKKKINAMDEENFLHFRRKLYNNCK